MKNREKMISLFIDLQRCHDGDLDQLSKTPTNSGYGLTLKLSHIGGLNLRVIFGTSKLIIGFGIKYKGIGGFIAEFTLHPFSAKNPILQVLLRFKVVFLKEHLFEGQNLHTYMFVQSISKSMNSDLRAM